MKNKITYWDLLKECFGLPLNLLFLTFMIIFGPALIGSMPIAYITGGIIELLWLLFGGNTPIIQNRIKQKEQKKILAEWNKYSYYCFQKKRIVRHPRRVVFKIFINRLLFLPFSTFVTISLIILKPIKIYIRNTLYDGCFFNTFFR